MNQLGLLTQKETAELLRINIVTLWRIKDKLPKPVQVGGARKFYRLQDLTQWLDNQQKGKENAK